MSQSILGIDIRSDSVSAVLITSSVSAYRIEGHRRVQMTGASENWESAVALALKEAVDPFIKAGTSSTVSVPAESLSFRNIRLPFKQPNKIAQVLSFELEPTLPFSVEDAVIGFDILSVPEDAGHTHVFAAAIEKKTLAFYLDILSAAGIKPEAIFFNGYTNARCLARFDQMPDHWISIDLEKLKCTLLAVVSGQIVMARNSLLHSRVKSTQETLSVLIRHSLISLEASHPFSFHPEIIVVSGSDQVDPNLLTDLEKDLEIPAVRFDLFRTMSSKGKKLIPAIPWNSLSGDSVLSVAMAGTEQIRGMNLLKGPFAPEKRLTEYRTPLVRAGIFLAAVVILAFAFLLSERHLTDKKIIRMDKRMTQIFQSTFPEEKVIVDSFQQMKAKMAEMKKKPAFSIDLPRDIPRIDLLKELTARIPKDLDLKIGRMVIGSEDILITGNTGTFNSVNDIKGQLEGSNLFSQVTISSANLDRAGSRIDFTLTIRF